MFFTRNKQFLKIMNFLSVQDHYWKKMSVSNLHHVLKIKGVYVGSQFYMRFLFRYKYLQK